MAYAQQYQTPDLASVLQSLAAFAPPNPCPPPQQQQPPVQHQQQPVDYELEEGEYDPSDFQPLTLPTTYPPQSYPQPPQPQTYQPPPPTLQPSPQPFHPSHQPQSSHPPHLQQSSHPTPPPPQPQPLPKPPSAPPSKAPTITTYPPALRHTTLLLTSSPHHTTRIRHLITTAHTHERQWYSGRQNLVKKLSGRKEARERLSVVLASINTGGGGNGGELEEGGKVVGAGGKQGEGYAGEEETKRELRLYDRKVWKAYGEMVRATERELAKLGIPFFCIEEGLVEKGRQGGAGGGEGKGGEGKVGEKELEALKGRMVGLLEDLVAE